MKKQINIKNRVNNNSGNTQWIVTRRTFLKTSASVIAGLSINPLSTSARERHSATLISFGIVTDSHYTNADPLGSRYYRESVAKMTECVSLMNDKKVDFLIELGDFKDQDNPPDEQSTMSYLRTIEKVFQTFKGGKYHVLGNHDLDSISKEQFMANIRNTNISDDSKYYSFDVKGFHFIVLDANYSTDGSDYDHGNFNWTGMYRKQNRTGLNAIWHQHRSRQLYLFTSNSMAREVIMSITQQRCAGYYKSIREF